MAKSKLVAVNKKIEKTVVERYKTMESGVTGSFQKISDGFVAQFLTKEGETVEQAQVRLKKESQHRKVGL